MSLFWNEDENAPRFGVWIAAVVIVIVLAVGGAFAWRWATAPARGALDAREQIQSGDFRIQAYDHFYNLCAAVQTAEAAVDATELQITTNTDPSDLNRLQINLNGQTVNRADAVNQYNADARKGYTEGQFRSASLPFTISTHYEPGVHTSCGN